MRMGSQQKESLNLSFKLRKKKERFSKEGTLPQTFSFFVSFVNGSQLLTEQILFSFKAVTILE